MEICGIAFCLYLVDMEMTSDPEPDSDIAKAPTISPLHSFGRYLSYMVARWLQPNCWIVCVWPFGLEGLWMAPLRYAAKLDPFLSLDCTPTQSTLVQSKESKQSNFAIWQYCSPSAPSFRVGGVGGRRGWSVRRRREPRRHLP